MTWASTEHIGRIASSAAVSSASGKSYGGSTKIRSALFGSALCKKRCTGDSTTRTWVTGTSLASATRRALSAATLTAVWSCSTKMTVSAPRLNASRPRAPEPAYRSTTRARSKASRASSAENNASRTRSLVGRVPCAGTFKMMEPAAPEMMRVTGEWYDSGRLSAIRLPIDAIPANLPGVRGPDTAARHSINT